MPACTNCGTLSEGAKFCPECGQSLVVTAVGEHRERRVVTILFADLAGFTSRSELLDVEDVDAFLAPYVDVIHRFVSRTGGVVSTVAGDGIMAVFGAPVAHEDDPERGVRAALGIREAFAPDSPTEDDGLHVRIGVTTGEVLVTVMPDGAVRATGDVVNTAARLQAAAPTGGVLVDETTHRATMRAIVLEPFAAVDAKGKSEPVAAWLAIDARSVVPEQTRLGGLVLVGRDVEANVLRGALDRVRRERSTQLISVIGEPGIGKSRLVEDLAEYIAEIPDLITWRVGRSLSYGEGVTFWALGEMVKSQAGILESDDAEVTAEKLATAVENVIVDEADHDWLIRHLARLVGLESSQPQGDGANRGEAFAAWRRFFEAIAEDGPTALVFEDVHWADEALLDFIDLLADRAGAIPLLIVCTARPELFERREHWGGGKINATTISLTPLSAEDTSRLVATLLDQMLLPAGVQNELLDRAGGNPLYAQEFIRMLQDRGLLVRGDGGWTLTGDARELPESIHGIIAARLDTLSPEQKALIQDASVIGKTAWVGGVSALGAQSTADVDELLHALERKQLLQRARRSSIRGETEFSFGHALTRDVAYSQIPRAERALKHEAAAEWIEAVAAERDDKAELLADHYHQSLELRNQLGQDTSELAPKACRAFAEAGHQAEANYAHAAAARLFESALELVPADDDRLRAELLLGRIVSRRSLGRVNDEELLATIEALVHVEEWEGAAIVERGYAHQLEGSGRGDEADRRLTLAAGYLSRIPPCDTTFLIAAHQAYRAATTGQYSRVLDITTELIPVAEAAGLEVGHAILLAWQGDVRVSLDDMAGLDEMRAAADTLARHSYHSVPAAYLNLADVTQATGDMRAATDVLDTALRWAQRLANLDYIMLVTHEQAYQKYHFGDWAASEQLLESVLPEPTAQNLRALMDAARGRGEDAIKSTEAVVAFALGTNDETTFYALAALARCHLSAGDEAAALRASERFLIRWHEGDGMYSRIMDLCEVAPILAAADRHEQIRSAAALAPVACRWRDALELVADGRYRDAGDLYRALGSLPLAAGIELLAAQDAAANHREAEARECTSRVAEFAERTQATWYSWQLTQMLRSSG
jgi:class 3 adenylate cyclase